jgi:hypothetical protein
VRVVDDLVDTGATAKIVHEMLPRAHFAIHHRRGAGHLDLLPLRLAFQPPIAKDGARDLSFPSDRPRIHEHMRRSARRSIPGRRLRARQE